MCINRNNIGTIRKLERVNKMFFFKKKKLLEIDSKIDTILKIVNKQEEEIQLISKSLNNIIIENQANNDAICKILDQFKKELEIYTARTIEQITENQSELLEEFVSYVSERFSKTEENILTEMRKAEIYGKDICEQLENNKILIINAIDKVNENSKISIELIEKDIKLLLLNSVMEQLP